MLVIGLTGPTGAGKGAVARGFEFYGLPVIDADEVYHRLLIPPSECLDELTRHFGTEILRVDGSLDRRRLGNLVFSAPDELEVLNTIAHRHVMKAIRQELEQLRRREIRAAVLDAPQLFEAGADRDCNIIVSVLADPKLRLERIMERDGLDADTAWRRISAQKSDEFFRTHSDFVIENNGNPDRLLPEVHRVLLHTGVASE